MTEADVQQLVRRLRDPQAREDSVPTFHEVLAACKTLHGRARSTDAIPLAMAALEDSERRQDAPRVRDCLMICGLLCADTGDVVAGVGYHLRALRFAAPHLLVDNQCVGPKRFCQRDGFTFA